MKLTTKLIKQLIREELHKLRENDDGVFGDYSGEEDEDDGIISLLSSPDDENITMGVEMYNTLNMTDLYNSVQENLGIPSRMIHIASSSKEDLLAFTKWALANGMKQFYTPIRSAEQMIKQVQQYRDFTYPTNAKSGTDYYVSFKKGK